MLIFFIFVKCLDGILVFKLLMPALMVTAGKDFVLLPALSKGMEDMVGERSSRTNVRDLK